MCGIFAYINYLTDKNLKDILTTILNGLRNLEYRGYDSCGICFDIKEDNVVKSIVAKATGPISSLEKVVEKYMLDNIIFSNHICIGHTRWATHGRPIAVNAHPHISSTNFEFVVVHNGIIFNYAELKQRILDEKMFSISTDKFDENEIIFEQTQESEPMFYSDTDTEVLAKLALFVYNKLYEQLGKKPTFLTVITNVMKIVDGTYGSVFKSSLYPGEVVACRLSSPLLIGLKYPNETAAIHTARFIESNKDDSFIHINDDLENSNESGYAKPCELFLSSDAVSFAESTKKTVILEDWDIVHISPLGVDIINTAPKSSMFSPSRTVETLNVSMFNSTKGEYPHFMLKEIMEQPLTLASTLRGRVTEDKPFVHLGGIQQYLDVILQSRTIMFIACGTSYNAALSIRPLFEQYTDKRILVEVASDFNDRKPVIFRDDVCVFISQSGETADTLVSLEYCLKSGAFCIGINNTPGSSISRQTHCGIHLNAGVEIGVASTKAYTSTILCLTLLLLVFIQDSIKQKSIHDEAIRELRKLPEYVSQALLLKEQVQELSSTVASQKSLIILGRGMHYATAREAALKIKELTYIHSEGLTIGELKHGPLALIDESAFVIFFATDECGDAFDACVTSLQQIHARGAQTLVVTTSAQIERVRPFSDRILVVPAASQWVQSITNIIPMQLLSYFVACRRGINVDRPRNLAKSVTVV